MENCGSKIQPALDHVSAWTKKLKAQMSPVKCCFTTFTLNPKKTGGKKEPRFVLDGQDVAFEANPAFLGIVLDDQFTFSKHADKVKKTMQQRAGSIALLSGDIRERQKDTENRIYCVCQIQLGIRSERLFQPRSAFNQRQARSCPKQMRSHHYGVLPNYRCQQHPSWRRRCAALVDPTETTCSQGVRKNPATPTTRPNEDMDVAEYHFSSEIQSQRGLTETNQRDCT